MTEMIFYAIMFSMFISFSFGCITFSSVHRTFSLMYRGLFECATSTIGEDGEPTAYFNKEKVSEYVITYLDDNLPRYVTGYEVSYYYLYEDSGLVCTSNQCSAVKISLKTDISYIFHYEKAMTFYISEGLKHE